MKKFAKGISLMLAFALVIVLLAGCTGDKPEKDVLIGEPNQPGASAPEDATKTAQINSKEDLVGKRIAVQEGTTGDVIATGIEGATVVRFKKGVDAAMELKNGRVDAVILDEIPSVKIVERNGDLVILNFPPTDDIEKYAIAVAKGNETLLTAVNATLDEMKADGTYETIFSIFISGEEMELPPIPEYVSKGQLIMGTNAEFEPFEYRNDSNEIVGFDVEIAKRIAAKLELELVVEDMPFDSLIAALSTGKINLIAAGMTNTEERAQNVDFSKDYYESNQVIIVKK